MELRPWEFSTLQPHEFQALLDGYLWRIRQEKTREDNSILKDAYFISKLMWMSGRTLKKQISASVIAAPLLKARDEEYLKKRSRKRREDEAYLKDLFKL